MLMPTFFPLAFWLVLVSVFVLVCLAFCPWLHPPTNRPGPQYSKIC
ncbi:Protein of unknown function [Lactobacillus delbrueckii subsp. lactis]|nr:Protein of unknown function [Lactobacillus delbrueckii subsp. lactis]